MIKAVVPAFDLTSIAQIKNAMAMNHHRNGTVRANEFAGGVDQFQSGRDHDLLFDLADWIQTKRDAAGDSEIPAGATPATSHCRTAPNTAKSLAAHLHASRGMRELRKTAADFSNRFKPKPMKPLTFRLPLKRLRPVIIRHHKRG
jgi:hypothetical protein